LFQKKNLFEAQRLSKNKNANYFKIPKNWNATTPILPFLNLNYIFPFNVSKLN
jgi:hypothetical protein